MENNKKTIIIIKELIKQTNDNMIKVKELRTNYITNSANEGVDYMEDSLQQASDRCVRAYDELLRELKHLEYENYENALIVSDYENLSEESREFVDDIKDEEYKFKLIRFLASKEKSESKNVKQTVNICTAKTNFDINSGDTVKAD
jgi:hypothetical protein